MLAPSVYSHSTDKIFLRSLQHESDVKHGSGLHLQRPHKFGIDYIA